MSPEAVGLVGIIVLIALFILRAPIGLSLLLVGFLGFAHLTKTKVALAQMGMSSFNYVSSFTFSVIPLFVLMGMFLSYSGLSKEMYYAADRWLGHIKGGIGIATIGACALFAAISGSSMSTASTIGKVSLPEMRRYNYEMGLGAATVAGGATLGILIPPSAALLIYGVITMEAIGPLLIAGIVPGILNAIMFAVVVYFIIRRNPDKAPTRVALISLRERFISLKGVWPFLLIFFVSIGGIYTGQFTATEAGAFGSFTSFLYCAVTRRLKWRQLLAALDDTVRTTAMIFLILLGANIFNAFIAVSRLPVKFTGLVISVDASPYTILIGILVMYFILGTFMEGIAIHVLTLPIVYPIIIGLGFSGVWFAIIYIIMSSIGTLTPPLGVVCYVTSGVDKTIPLTDIFRNIIPFVLTMLVLVAILVIFPQIVLFLPNLMH